MFLNGTRRFPPLYVSNGWRLIFNICGRVGGFLGPGFKSSLSLLIYFITHRFVYGFHCFTDEREPLSGPNMFIIWSCIELKSMYCTIKPDLNTQVVRLANQR